MKVIIDAGHGGSDPGGGSNYLWKEKDMNLKISDYQKRRFDELGIPNALVRNSDITLSPSERVRRTRSLTEPRNSILLSNHINSGGGKGAEVIYSIRDDNTLPLLIADNIRATGQNVRNVYTRVNSQGSDYYFIIRDNPGAKSMIIEYGFANNPVDREFIYNNWPVLAEAVVRAVSEYLKVPYSAPRDIIHIVRPGESLYSISQMYDVSINDLKRYNGLTQNTIYVGQQIIIGTTPTATIYTVKRGDTLYNIARRYNTTINQIKQENNLTSDVIYVGQNLKLSSGVTKEITHTVQKGESLYALAKRYNTTVENIKRDNNLKSDIIYVGQTLNIYQ